MPLPVERTIPIDGKKIAQLREARGLKQKDFAKATGLTQGSISRIESDPAPAVYRETLDLLCKALQCSEDDLRRDAVVPTTVVLVPTAVWSRWLELATDHHADVFTLLDKAVGLLAVQAAAKMVGNKTPQTVAADLSSVGSGDRRRSVAADLGSRGSGTRKPGSPPDGPRKRE